MSVPVAPWPDFDGSQACAGPDVDPEWFFPQRNATSAGEYRAYGLCRSCAWVRDCLAYALTHDVSGIWGATSELTRQQVRIAHDLPASRIGLNQLSMKRSQP